MPINTELNYVLHPQFQSEIPGKRGRYPPTVAVSLTRGVKTMISAGTLIYPACILIHLYTQQNIIHLFNVILWTRRNFRYEFTFQVKE